MKLKHLFMPLTGFALTWLAGWRFNMLTKNKMLKAAIASALLLLTAYARADVLSHAFRSVNSFLGGQPAFIPLNEAGATSVAFSGSGRFTIFYTAECAVDGANTDVWLNIDIIVDGVKLLPTGNNNADAFCTSNGTTGFDGWTMVAAWGHTARLAAGNHTVQIRAGTSDGLARGSVGDSSLVIIRYLAIPSYLHAPFG